MKTATFKGSITMTTQMSFRMKIARMNHVQCTQISSYKSKYSDIS